MDSTHAHPHDTPVCPGCMERERQRDAWIESSRQKGVKAEERKQAWRRERETRMAAERTLAAIRELLTSGPIGRESGERYIRADYIRRILDERGHGG